MNYPVKTAGQLKDALRSLRQARGITQAGLGRQIGLSQERISAIEHRPERITIDQLLTVLMALDQELVIQPRRPTPKASW